MVRHQAAEPAIPVRHSPSRHRHWLRYTIALSVASVLLFAFSGVGFAYLQLQGNIKTGNESSLLDEANRPKRVGAAPKPGDPFTGRALNIVLIGSDTRSGDNQAIGGGNVGGMRSDTTILAHISKDRSRAEMVSFPRDMMVAIPACKRSDGSSTNATFNQFNAAFAYGGEAGDVTSAAACTIGAIETLTDIRVDGFVVVDMSGFESVIDAIGGVDLCIPNAIDAPKADLKLDAGMHHLDGKTALGYARARTGVGLGDGSDIQRIERQQKLLGAVSRTILSSKVLTSPGKLYGMLNSITQALTMTKDYASVPALAGLGVSLASLNKDHVAFITVPNGPYAPDPNRVVATEPLASELFESIRNDEPVKGTPAWKATHKNDSSDDGVEVADDGDALSPGSSPSATISQSALTGQASVGFASATSGSLRTKPSSPTATDDPEANPYGAKTGGADVDVCEGQQ